MQYTLATVYVLGNCVGACSTIFTRVWRTYIWNKKNLVKIHVLDIFLVIAHGSEILYTKINEYIPCR